MPNKLTWLGHNTWEITAGDCTILLDPFLQDSPVATKKPEEVTPNYILLSHGHYDHVSDAIAIAQKSKAKVVSNFEICEWLKNNSIVGEQTVPMNLGGTISLPFGTVTMTLAHHSSGLPDGSYGGTAAGFIVHFKNGPRIYFACDTALFLDMKLIGMKKLDFAVLPIGDCFTMGPEDSLEAIRLLNPKRVLPCHYNTWPPIEQDANAWAEQVRRDTAAEPFVLKPGESLDL